MAPEYLPQFSQFLETISDSGEAYSSYTCTRLIAWQGPLFEFQKQALLNQQITLDLALPLHLPLISTVKEAIFCARSLLVSARAKEHDADMAREQSERSSIRKSFT